VNKGVSEENKPPTALDVAEEMTEEHGLFYTVLTKLIGWALFMAFLALIIGTGVFIALALYRGILWAWPGGPAA